MKVTKLFVFILTLLDTSNLSNYKIKIIEFFYSFSGLLKLAIPDSILIYNMQPFIRAFAHEAPNVQLVINSIRIYRIIKSKLLNFFILFLMLL